MIETAYYRGKCDGLMLVSDLIEPNGDTAKRLFAAYIKDVTALASALDEEREQSAVNVSDSILEMMESIETAPLPVAPPALEPAPLVVDRTNGVTVRFPDSGVSPSPILPQAAQAMAAAILANAPQVETKPCVICNSTFARPEKMPPSQWKKVRTCSSVCRYKAAEQSKKASKTKVRADEQEPEAPAPRADLAIDQARGYIQQCVMSRKPIDRGVVHQLTGYTHGTLSQFIQQVQDAMAKEARKPVLNIKGLERLAKALHGDDDDEEPDADELDAMEAA